MKMFFKSCLITMAFFMSFLSQSQDLRDPDIIPMYEAKYSSITGIAESKSDAYILMCKKWALRWNIDASPPDTKYSFTGRCVYDDGAEVIKSVWQPITKEYKEYTQIKDIYPVNYKLENIEKCPNPAFPEYTITVINPNDSTKIMCAKPPEPKENDDDCPQIGDVPNLSFGTGSNQTMCFANLNNPSTSKTCNYTSDSSGMYELPDLGAQEPIACNDGASDNDDGEQTKPDDPTKDPDGCFQSSNGKYCDADPNDTCNIVTGLDGKTSYNCSNGCGVVNGEFMCPKENNNDGLPSLDCSDADYAAVNDHICSVDNVKDKDGDGQVDNSDVVQGLNELKQNQEEANDSLKKSLDELKNLDDKANEGNKLLAKIDGKLGNIDENVAAIKKGLEPSKEVLKGINDDGQLDKNNKDYEDKIKDFQAKSADKLGFKTELDMNTSVLGISASDGCQVYTYAAGGFALDLDLCSVSNRVKPFLYWIFAVLTMWNIFYTVTKTIKGE